MLHEIATAAHNSLQAAIQDIFTLTPSAEPNTAYPGDNACTIWEGENFSGRSHTYELNYREPVVHNLAGTDMDNVNSSWWCGKNVAYRFCSGGAQVECGTFTSGAGSGRSAVMGHQDTVSSIQLYPYDPDVQGAVTLF